MPLPVGDGEKFRRHHPERQSLWGGGAAGIGVVAGADLDRRLDQEAADVIADRAERIGGWPTTVPAIAGGSGVLLADSDGGIDSRNGNFESTGTGLPGPGGGFGLA